MSIQLTTEEFKQKVFDFHTSAEWKFEGDVPCIIDFYTDTCPPCKVVAPILEQISHEYAGKLNVYKVNTEQEEELQTAFGIHSVPTLLFIPQTGDPRMSIGALPKAQILKAMKDVMAVE